MNVLQQMPAIVLLLDRELKCLYLTNSARLAFGLSKTALADRYLYEAVPSFPEDWQEWLERALAGESIHRDAEMVELSSGARKWFRLDIQPWGDQPGSAEGILFFAQDITIEKEAAFNLSAQYERLDKLVSLVPDAICAFRLFPDGSTAFPYASPRFRALLSQLPDLTEDATPLFEAIHPQDATRVRASVNESARMLEAWNENFRISMEGDEQVWLEGHSMPVRETDGSTCWYGILKDITERKRIEESLLETQAEYRALVDNSPDAIVRVDRNCRYLFANKRFQEATGLDLQALLGKTPQEAGMDPDMAEQCQRQMQQVLETGHASLAELMCPTIQGRGVWEVRNIPEFAADGTIHSVLMIGLDISQRREAELLASQQQEQLKERESIISTLFETASQAILAVNAEGRIELINRMAEEIFGYQHNELIGQPHELLIPEQLREKHTALRQAFMAAPRNRPMGTGNPLLALRKDGTTFPVEVSLSFVNSANGPLAVSFLTDITQRVQSATALLESEKELRKLSASLINVQEESSRKIALELHDDITQRLAFLSMEIGKLAAQTLPPETMISGLRSFQSRILEISESIRQISHEMHPSILDDLGLEVAIEAMCADFQRLHGVQTRFSSRAIPEQLDRKAAMCLYRVSQESLRNASKHSKSKDLSVVLSREGDFVQLAVIDSGVGFDPANHKEGFGMQSMRERVRQLNGSIQIDSLPGEGTRVVVRVPWKQEAV